MISVYFPEWSFSLEMESIAISPFVAHIFHAQMNYPAASYGVSIGNYCNAPRGRESNLYPPQEDLSASGGLKNISSRITSRRLAFGVSTDFNDKPDSYFRVGASVLLCGVFIRTYTH
jgi:hypothetical protein